MAPNCGYWLKYWISRWADREPLKSCREHLAAGTSLWSHFTTRCPSPQQRGSWAGLGGSGRHGGLSGCPAVFWAGPSGGRNQVTTWQEANACPRKASETAACSYLDPQAGAGCGMGAGFMTQHPVCSPAPACCSRKPTARPPAEQSGGSSRTRAHGHGSAQGPPASQHNARQHHSASHSRKMHLDVAVPITHTR